MTAQPVSSTCSDSSRNPDENEVRMDSNANNSSPVISELQPSDIQTVVSEPIKEGPDENLNVNGNNNYCPPDNSDGTEEMSRNQKRPGEENRSGRESKKVKHEPSSASIADVGSSSNSTNTNVTNNSDLAPDRTNQGDGARDEVGARNEGRNSEPGVDTSNQGTAKLEEMDTEEDTKPFLDDDSSVTLTPDTVCSCSISDDDLILVSHIDGNSIDITHDYSHSDERLEDVSVPEEEEERSDDECCGEVADPEYGSGSSNFEPSSPDSDPYQLSDDSCASLHLEPYERVNEPYKKKSRRA